AMHERARRLYLRARDYGRRGLELRYPGAWAALEQQDRGALARVKRKRDVPLLYWTAAAEGKAIAESKGDPAMIAQLPVVEALLQRAQGLDPDWNAGALDAFAISLEAARPDVSRAAALAAMRASFERALALSGGHDASLFVTYAESASVLAQDRAQFNQMLDRALAINADDHPANRLMNLIAQRRARWLRAHGDDLIAGNPRTPAAIGGGLRGGGQ
ncbi:MAG: TRAP transporter TatT component family protein, partial [Terriglobales bacterium]